MRSADHMPHSRPWTLLGATRPCGPGRDHQGTPWAKDFQPFVEPALCASIWRNQEQSRPFDLPLRAANPRLAGMGPGRSRQVLATSRCETHGIDPVFMRGAGGGARPNVAICLTAPERTRDGERAARRGSTRGYAAHAVRTLRPAGLIRGRRLRVDTTVVETNIHYPTDSTLLADGVRVLTRTLRRLGAPGRERTRSVARRVFEIAQRSRTTGARASQRVRERTKARMTMLYQGLMRITRAVVREAEAAVTQLPPRPRRRVRRLAERLHATLGVVRRVLAQTRARVLHGDTHFPAKVVSVFEPHTEIIRKGKLAKPTEFGRLVMIQEAEAQFITDYQVCERRPSDRALWVPALDRHRALFGHPPQLAVADGGFASRQNERAAQDRGVRHVVLPWQPRARRSRAARAALRWRTGSEGRISALKRCHGLRRCRYRGSIGMQRWVGLGVIANNLTVLGRAGPRAA